MRTPTSRWHRRPAHSRIVWLALAQVILAVSSGEAQGLEIVHPFPLLGEPQSKLILASDGYLWGTTRRDGPGGKGSVFRIDAAGNLTTVYGFGCNGGQEPWAGVIQGSDGKFYGTTNSDGETNKGTVFKVDSAGNLTILHLFTGGVDGKFPNAALVQASDGKFYGMTAAGGSYNYGTVFKIDSAGNLTTLHSFNWSGDGSYPGEALIQATDGKLYGTTSDGGPNGSGTVFRIDTAGNFATVHGFNGADGASPTALVQAPDGKFYGATGGGGASYLGTVFRMDLTGGTETLHDFNGSDGSGPSALARAADGNLYGMTFEGGTDGFGTVFRIDAAGSFTTLHSFNGANGAYPVAGPTKAPDGSLYGTTYLGGVYNSGTVFRIDSAGSFSSIHSFGSVEGSQPAPGFIQASDGPFYFATHQGGPSHAGGVFRLDATGDVTTVHGFDALTGFFADPFVSAIIQGTDGSFYGTTHARGANQLGSVYKVDSAGTLTLLHSFDGMDGAYPFGWPLVQASDGNLYGTTSQGGASGLGMIFRVSPTGTFEKLHDLNVPFSSVGLMQASDGYLYGGGGTIFRIDLAGNVTTLYALAGDYSIASLVEASDGYLYGATASGSIFKIDAAGNFNIVHTFAIDEGVPDILVEGSDGLLYGATFRATPRGTPLGGLVFKMTLSGVVIVLADLECENGGTPSSVLLGADGAVYGTTIGGSSGGGAIFRLLVALISSIAPSSGPASGGTPVTITGSSFLTGASVAIGGVPATGVTVVDSTHVTATTPALTPGTLNDVSVANPTNLAESVPSTLPDVFFADFLDVPQSDIFHDYVEKILRNGITAGCGSGNYCRNSPVTRAQMAVFLLKAEHGAGYAPSACTGSFPDVPCPGTFADWIEQLAADGITGGCGGGNYCPDSPVTRQQMAVFLLKTEHTSAYVPPACAGIFDDVACPSTFADWVEQLSAEGVTGGCQVSPPLYCPTNSVTRGQMAVFLVKTFQLQ